jgi:hypothetical protein
MFQGEGMILEGGMEIRLGYVAGVVGFGEKAKIGQLKAPDHLPLFRKAHKGGLAPVRCMESQGYQEKEADQQVTKKEIRFSHKLQSMFFMVSAVTSWNLSINLPL